MERNFNTVCQKLYDTILSDVVNSTDSPYELMMRKAKDIDLDYFEQITHSENTLSPELNMELKDKVVCDFGKMADGYYVEGNLEERLLTMALESADRVKVAAGESARKECLASLASRLQSYADRMQLLELPRFTDKAIREKYKYAKEITIDEFLLSNNYKDVLDFYSALMDKTWYACQELIVQRTKQFLLTLADKIRTSAVA